MRLSQRQRGIRAPPVRFVVVGTPQLPTVDPEKPAEKVEIGVADGSAEVIDDTLTQIVGKVLNDMDIGEAVDDQTKAAIKEAVEQDKPITIVIKTETLAPSQVDADDAAKTEAVAGAGADVAQYLDISMILQADGREIGTLNRLVGSITVQVAIPGRSARGRPRLLCRPCTRRRGGEAGHRRAGRRGVF